MRCHRWAESSSILVKETRVLYMKSSSSVIAVWFNMDHKSNHKWTTNHLWFNMDHKSNHKWTTNHLWFNMNHKVNHNLDHKLNHNLGTYLNKTKK